MRKYGVIYIVATCCWVLIMLGCFVLFATHATQSVQSSHPITVGPSVTPGHAYGGPQPQSLAVNEAPGIGFLALLPVSFGVMIIGSLAFWIFAIIHVAKNDRLKDNERIVWILVVVLLHTLGATVYFLAAPEPLPKLPQS